MAPYVPTKTVALLLDDRDNHYQQLLVRDAQRLAPRHGIELQPPEFAGGSSWTQLESLQAHLRAARPPDGVLVMLAGAQLTSGAFARVSKAGLATVFLNRVPPWIDELRTTFPRTLVGAVAPRQEGIGALQARHAFQLARAGAFVILVTGEERSQAAVARERGFLDTVRGRFDVRLLNGRWSTDGAAQALGEWFRFGAERDARIDLVVCQNDAMTAGVRQALARQASAAGRPELLRVPLIGCDGLEQEGMAMVRRGELAATVVLPSTAPVALEMMQAHWAAGGLSVTRLLDATSFPALSETSSLG